MRSALLFLSLGLILCFGNAPRGIVGGAIRSSSNYHGSAEISNIVDNDIVWPEVQPLKSRFESWHPARYFSPQKRCRPGYRPDAKGRCRPVLL